MSEARPAAAPTTRTHNPRDGVRYLERALA